MADYRQFELRILAAVSGDAAPAAAFAGGADPHTQGAARLFGVAPEAVTVDQRRRAKKVNFGVIYGMTARGLADALGISRPAADGLISDFFAAFPGVAAWRDQVLADPGREHLVRSRYGRRRRWSPAVLTDRAGAAAAGRQAVNLVVQATAADLFKLALAPVHQILPAGARLLLPVHDGVLVEAPEAAAAVVAGAVKAATEEVTPRDFPVPLVATGGTGRTWQEAAGPG